MRNHDALFVRFVARLFRAAPTPSPFPATLGLLLMLSAAAAPGKTCAQSRVPAAPLVPVSSHAERSAVDRSSPHPEIRRRRHLNPSAPATASAGPVSARQAPSSQTRRAVAARPAQGAPETAISLDARSEKPDRESRSQGRAREGLSEEGLSGERVAILKARAAYQRTGDARIIRRGTQLTLPYGHTQPTIRAAPYRFTLMELAENEYVKKPFIADPERWSVDYGTKGVTGDFTQVIAIKPLQCGLASNMAFLTNQGRIYNVTFRSSPCSGGDPLEEASSAEERPYAVHVNFYYPDEAAAETPPPPEQSFSPAPPPTMISAEELAAGSSPARSFPRNTAAGGQAQAPRRVRGLNPPPDMAHSTYAQSGYAQSGSARSRAATMPSVSLGDLNTAYTVKKDDEFPCAPVSVSDDGRRLFVRFPTGDSDCQQSFPIYAEGPDDNLRLINYTVLDGNLYVTNGVPKKAVMIYQSDGDRHTLHIRKKSD